MAGGRARIDEQRYAAFLTRVRATQTYAEDVSSTDSTVRTYGTISAFGGYTAYQMDPDGRAIKWTTDQIGPAVFYYSQELNETFLSVYT